MIRQAKKSDAPKIAPLLLVIWKDMELPILEVETEDAITSALVEAIQTEDYRYSYRHLHVYEKDGDIAGVLAGYPGKIEPEIDHAWNAIAKKQGITYEEPIFVDKETFPGEWYLDSIVTNEKYRGHGVGTALLAKLTEIAAEEGEKVVGLNCDKGNPHAKRLYERLGFHVTGEITLSGHEYEHMQK
ncbi:GNAT family N-acetyltransferase [Listeria swaminathanii]|uniref:GNAT family N-acetyltransferase n=1 Tax=Listeria swaminathanii TaxID=2713501 RepID=A0ABU2IE05_9LIST|nr:GNAT family N-acetyltransferase [Listeria swaminathanii]MDT0016108.1 GNAT family N-acetyltransferase [Listeria swaminathanii]MDT0021544.1 GNAT family N-acetyltransferase [Listeria swaminathanii]MDT0032508.1 GNAT family N-acetyltransferase [Listeria swaminathanii]MDT0051642.1 GNAT family N-acetyltransferase [Listeria swaminathanii]MDT0054407.1 GNAT family N-acetyltransferase [Listeria swaminathanii]